MIARRTVVLGAFAAAALAGPEALAQGRYSPRDIFALPDPSTGAPVVPRALGGFAPHRRAVFAQRGAATRRPVARSAQSAEASTPNEQEAARRAYYRGVELANQHQWAQAAEAFEESYRHAQRPNTLFNLGVAHRSLDRYTRAIDELTEFLRNAADTPDLAAQREQAEQMVAEMRGQLASVAVNVVPENAQDVTVTLDNQPITEGEAVPADPGNHLLVVTARGYTRDARTITLTRGQRSELNVRLTQPGGIGAGGVVLIIAGAAVVAGGVVAAVLLLSREAAPDCGTLNICVSPSN